MVYCLVGESENIKLFKEKFRKTYNIKDLGKLKRYEIWYEWIKDGEESMVKIKKLICTIWLGK